MTVGPGTQALRGCEIVGTGVGLPQRVLTNADLEQMVDTSDEWITQRTGIKTRRIADKDQDTSDLAALAVQQALDRAGLAGGDLDLLICATMTPDMICPATACQVVEKIGAIPCGSFDINIACTGFVAGLNMADSLIRTGHYRHIAVVAADKLSKIVDWEDRGTCVLFGDAAGAAILGATEDPAKGCMYQSMGSDADRGVVLYVPRDRQQVPESETERFSGRLNTLQMNGKIVYKFAVEKLAECVDEALAAHGLSPDDIAMVVPHQSNMRMLKSAWKRLGFPEQKIHINIDRFGNTSAASAAVCLDELVCDGAIKPRDKIIFVAQGGGLSWGVNLWQM